MKSGDKHDRKDIARVQLRRAIQLFKEGDYICSLTLAGAAEELLGRMSEHRTGTQN